MKFRALQLTNNSLNIFVREAQQTKMGSSCRILILVICIVIRFQSSFAIVRDSRTKKLDPSLNEAFHTPSLDSEKAITQNIVVVFEDSTDEVLNTVNIDAFDTFEDYHLAYKSELRSLKKESQSEVADFLNKTNKHSKSLWLTNEIFIKDATLELCQNLGSFDNVVLIRKEEILQVHKPVHSGAIIERTNETINAVEWNIEMVGAPAIWSQNNFGEGITVGIIDTGIRPTHECFQDPPGKINGWFDAVAAKAAPYDDQGHGSHVAGIVAGSKGIGMAPKANIMACKACDGSGSCSESSLKTCCQRMADNRPHLVSNSWGGSSSNTYQSAINTLVALGIFPFFSAGNSGPSCQTMGSPGDYANVISVGSTTNQDAVSDFSSRGQCISGLVGPTCSAPGSNILSAWKSSDTAYRAISGTSMACPHVSGLAALMIKQNPGITFNQLKTAITSGSKKTNLVAPNQSCGGTPADEFPNNMFGSGRIDCASIMKLI